MHVERIHKMQECLTSGDISELLNDMTPDERNLLRTKMSNLASKL